MTAVSTIMIINNKTCLYGDGATALVQNSGKVEWIKTTIESRDDSGKWGEGYKVTVSLKRRDQDNHTCVAFHSRTRNVLASPASRDLGLIILRGNATGVPLHGLIATAQAMRSWAWRLRKR